MRDALRNAILSGDLPGDAQLVQTDIAEQLGVSTTPVREAMRDLVVEGLIAMNHHKIGTVRKPDWAEMAEIARVRQSLEPLAIELQHLEPVVIERINGYFGYRAVERLSMVRGPLPPRRDDVPAAPPAADAAALQKAAGIEDEALREALTSLGGHVLSRGRGSAPR